MRLFFASFVLFALGCSSGPRSSGTERASATAHEHTVEATADDDDEAPPPSTTPTTRAALPVDGTRAMATLSEAELASVCAWLVDNAPHRRVECEDGPTFEVGVGHDQGCPPAAAFAGCTLTVAQATTCMADNAEDPCAHGMFGAPTCAEFRECMLLQMGMVREEPTASE